MCFASLSVVVMKGTVINPIFTPKHVAHRLSVPLASVALTRISLGDLPLFALL